MFLTRHVRRQALEVAGQSTVQVGKLHRAQQVRARKMVCFLRGFCSAALSSGADFGKCCRLLLARLLFTLNASFIPYRTPATF